MAINWLKQLYFNGLHHLKFKYREILQPVVKKLVNINPDIVSYIATFFNIFTGLCFIWTDKHPILFIVIILLIVLRMTLNTLDGAIATAQGRDKVEGKIVNALPDRYSDFFLFGGLALCPYSNLYLGIATLASVFLVSYSGILGKALGMGWQGHGPFGKVERLSLVMIASLLQYLAISLNVNVPFGLMNLAMVIFIILAQLTVYNRVNGILTESKGK